VPGPSRTFQAQVPTRAASRAVLQHDCTDGPPAQRQLKRHRRCFYSPWIVVTTHALGASNASCGISRARQAASCQLRLCMAAERRRRWTTGFDSLQPACWRFSKLLSPAMLNLMCRPPAITGDAPLGRRQA
jgi:hypothetical protein